MNNPLVKNPGTLRWRLFFTLALMYILVYFYRVSLAVVAGDISRELSLSPEQLGTLAGILFYVYAVAQIPLGPLIDRFGGRLVISGCGLLTVAGGFVFAQARTLEMAMAGRVLIGIGTAAVLMATFAIFSHWYDKQEFGRISGLMVAAGNLGNLAGTAPLALLVGFSGWRGAFLGIAVLQLLVTLLVFLKVRDIPPGHASDISREDGGNLPLRPGMFDAWKIIARDRSFWLLAAVSFCWYGNYLAVQGLWGGPYLTEVLGLTREGAGAMLMWTSVGFIAGSVLMDKAARQLFHSYKWALIAGQCCLLILMTGFLGWLDALSRPLLGVYFFVVGCAVSSGIMIYPIIRASFPVSIVGTALTSLNFFVLMGAAMAQQVMGLVVERMGGYSPQAFHAAFAVPVAGLLIAILLYLFARNCPAG